MDYNGLILISEIIIGFLIFLISILAIVYFLISRKKVNVENGNNGLISDEQEKTDVKKQNIGRFKENLNTESIYKFMEFDEVKDNTYDMIVRKRENHKIFMPQSK